MLDGVEMCVSMQGGFGDLVGEVGGSVLSIYGLGDIFYCQGRFLSVFAPVFRRWYSQILLFAFSCFSWNKPHFSWVSVGQYL